MLQVTFCCWVPIPIMKRDIFAGAIGFDQSFIPTAHYFQSNSWENGQILSVVIISIQQMRRILRLALGGRSEVTLKTSDAILKIPPRKFSVLCDRAKNRLLWHLLCFEILLDVFLKEVQWYPLCVTNSGG